MRKHRPIRPRRALALALVLGLSVSCGDDDGPTGNGGGAGGPLGDFASLLNGTAEKYFENNEAAFLSLQNFAPSFQGVLSVAPAVAGTVASASSLQQVSSTRPSTGPRTSTTSGRTCTSLAG